MTEIPDHLLKRSQAAKATVMAEEMSRSQRKRREIQEEEPEVKSIDMDQIMRDHIKGIETENVMYRQRMEEIRKILDKLPESKWWVPLKNIRKLAADK